MRFNYWIYVAILSGLGGCAAPSDVMIRPSDGATVRCSSTGVGLLGAPAALISKSGCVSDFRALGYVTSDEYQAFKNQNRSLSVPSPVDSGYGSGRVSGSSNQIPSQASELKEVKSSNLFIESKDGGYSISLSNEWVQLPPPEIVKRSPGGIFVSNQTKGAHFIVATEDASDISNFQMFNESKLSELSAKLANAYKSDIQYVTINGREAARFETSGQLSNGQNVHYLYTIINTKKKMIKITSWSGESKFQANKELLMSIANAVKTLE